MNNKIFENMFKNMNYSVYKKIDTISFLSIYGCNVANFFVNSEIASISLLIYDLLACTYYIVTNINNCEIYTKEISRVIKLYNDLIESYTKLINVFELKNPIEIYSMYNYTLYNGYLSNGGKFTYGKGNIEDTRPYFGLNVLTGEAVCRHISGLLVDIYNNIGMNSINLPVHLNSNEELIKKIYEALLLLHAELDQIIDNELKKNIEESIITLEEKIKPFETTENKFNFSKKIKPNHAITLLENNNKCYLLDPTNEVIYQKDSTFDLKNVFNSTFTSSDGSTISLCKKGMSDFKKYKKEAQKILLLQDYNNQEDKIIFETTTNLCKDNLDILESFRNENKELYQEVNDTLVKIKKKK